MSFDAYKRIRDTLNDMLTDDLPAILATVATEQGVTLPALHKVMRHTNKPPSKYPVAIVGTVRGDVDDAGSITTTGSCVVMFIISGSDPDKLDEQMDGYLTAAVRLFAKAQKGDMQIEVRGFDADKPSPIEGSLLQTCGVLIGATVSERA